VALGENWRGRLARCARWQRGVERENIVRSISPYFGCVFWLCVRFMLGLGLVLTTKVLPVSQKSRNLSQFIDKRN
jgi:hypothetical protein